MVEHYFKCFDFISVIFVKAGEMDESTELDVSCERMV